MLTALIVNINMVGNALTQLVHSSLGIRNNPHQELEELLDSPKALQEQALQEGISRVFLDNPDNQDNLEADKRLVVGKLQELGKRLLEVDNILALEDNSLLSEDLQEAASPSECLSCGSAWLLLSGSAQPSPLHSSPAWHLWPSSHPSFSSES